MTIYAPKVLAPTTRSRRIRNPARRPHPREVATEANEVVLVLITGSVGLSHQAPLKPGSVERADAFSVAAPTCLPRAPIGSSIICSSCWLAGTGRASPH